MFREGKEKEKKLRKFFRVNNGNEMRRAKKVVNDHHASTKSLPNGVYLEKLSNNQLNFFFQIPNLSQIACVRKSVDSIVESVAKLTNTYSQNVKHDEFVQTIKVFMKKFLSKKKDVNIKRSLFFGNRTLYVYILIF